MAPFDPCMHGPDVFVAGAINGWDSPWSKVDLTVYNMGFEDVPFSEQCLAAVEAVCAEWRNGI